MRSAGFDGLRFGGRVRVRLGVGFVGRLLGRRQVRARARDAGRGRKRCALNGGQSAGGDLGHALLAANDRRRIEALLGFFFGIRLELRADVDADACRADDRLEQLDDARRQFALDALLALERNAVVGLVVGVSGLDSGRPKLSMMTTASGRSPSTLAATSPVIAATVDADSGGCCAA